MADDKSAANGGIAAANQSTKSVRPVHERMTSVPENGLIWFGAAVSVAEILTGASLAPLGFKAALAALIVGHVIGCALLFCAGIIGARTRKAAMETVRFSFGKAGSVPFAACNVLQLVGWTAVMTFAGAQAAQALFPIAPWFWCLVIAGLIAVWVCLGITRIGKLNVVVLGLLFILTIVLSVVVFNGGTPVVASAATGEMSFGMGVELAIAMPLSWLPLISDYTRTAARPVAATATSAGVYFFVSCWMFVIGLAAALFTGESDVGVIMLAAGLGAAGLIIVVLSTVTTTFLDVHSAAVSAKSVVERIPQRGASLIVLAVGTIIAVFMPENGLESFLYLIGSVFAPMISILIVDWFILHRDVSAWRVDWVNLALWAGGFALYRIFLGIDTPLGSTVPVMAIVMAVTFAINKTRMRRGAADDKGAAESAGNNAA